MLDQYLGRPSGPAIVLALLATTSYALYNLFLHPLSSVPGPIGCRTGLLSWRFLRGVKRDMGWKLLYLHAKYGKVVRIARNEVSVCDPNAISQIYRFKSSLEKSQFYESLRGIDGPTALSTASNKRHAEMRRAEAPAFALKYELEVESKIDACCAALVAHLDRCIDEAAAGKATKAAVDIGEALQLFAIDAAGELAFSKSFDLCTAGGDTQGMLPMLVRFLEMACLAGTQPRLAPWIGTATILLPEFKTARRFTTLVRERIDARFTAYGARDAGGYVAHRDMLETILAARNPDGSEYSLQQVRAAVGLILGAGSDTTAITMRAMIRLVIGHPEICAKLLREIDDAGVVIPLSYADAGKLEYSRCACLKETLRLHPPVPWPLPRVVGAGGAHIAGHFFVEGTEVSMSPFVLHRSPEAYGADAGAFRPERWLAADPESRREMEHNNMAFGAGPRVCAGKNIGMMELSKVLPVLFSRYGVRFTPRNAGSPHVHRAGRSVDGRVARREPYVVTSQWVATQSDFWCDLSRKEDAVCAQ